MRKRKEIIEKIAQIRAERDFIKPMPKENERIWKQTCNALIHALEYSLGYKKPPFYWCIKCMRYHKGLTCPKCGNDKYIGVIDKGNFLSPGDIKERE